MIYMEQDMLYVLKWHYGDESKTESVLENEPVKIILKDEAMFDSDTNVFTGTLKSVSFDSLQIESDKSIIPIYFDDIKDVIKL